MFITQSNLNRKLLEAYEQGRQSREADVGKAFKTGYEYGMQKNYQTTKLVEQCEDIVEKKEF